MDLSDLIHMDLSDYYLAATRDLGMNLNADGITYIKSVEGLIHNQYLQAGFILMNCKKIKQDKLTNTFQALARRKLRYQDQDILNLACSGKVTFLPMKYNMTDYTFLYINLNRSKITHLFKEEEIEEAQKNRDNPLQRTQALEEIQHQLRHLVGILPPVTLFRRRILFRLFSITG